MSADDEEFEAYEAAQQANCDQAKIVWQQSACLSAIRAVRWWSAASKTGVRSQKNRLGSKRGDGSMFVAG
jgi:hypothetical protein